MRKTIFTFIGGMIAGIAATLFAATIIPMDDDPEKPEDFRDLFF